MTDQPSFIPPSEQQPAPTYPQPAPQPQFAQPQYPPAQYPPAQYGQPQHPGYQPVYYAPRPPANGLAVTAMILGIIAIVFTPGVPIPFLGLFFAVLAVAPGIGGVISGHMGLRAAQRQNGVGRGQAFAGLILGYIAVGVILSVTLFWLIGLATYSPSH